MELRLQKILFRDVEIKAETSSQEVTRLVDTTMTFGTVYSATSHREFAVEFTVKLETAKKDFKLKVVAFAQFSTSGDIDAPFKDSQFVKVSAPAIAFPYVRTFISNLTLNSGYDAIVLPSFNFLKLSQELER